MAHCLVESWYGNRHTCRTGSGAKGQTYEYRKEFCFADLPFGDVSQYVQSVGHVFSPISSSLTLTRASHFLP